MQDDVVMRLNRQQVELLHLVVDRWELGSVDELVMLALQQRADELSEARE